MGLVTQEETEFCLCPSFLIHTPPKPLESLKDMSFVWYGWLWPGGSWIASEWGEGVARGTNQLIRGLAHWPQPPGKVKLITKGNDVLYCACNEASVKKKNKNNKKPLPKRFWEDTLLGWWTLRGAERTVCLERSWKLCAPSPMPWPTHLF